MITCQKFIFNYLHVDKLVYTCQMEENEIFHVRKNQSEHGRYKATKEYPVKDHVLKKYRIHGILLFLDEVFKNRY